MEVLWFNLAWQLSTTKNGWWEDNVMTETSYTALVSGTLSSSMYVPAQCFLSAVERSWQSPPSTPVPWDPLRAVSGKFFVRWCETAASLPEESQTFTCLPAMQLQATLLLAGVVEPCFPSNQEKETCEMMESNGS